jgi:hypothetical protein
MPTSEKQIIANRQNAQKSTGPKTETGKKTSSHNAITHGLHASDIVSVGGPPRRVPICPLLILSTIVILRSFDRLRVILSKPYTCGAFQPDLNLSH